VLHGRRGREGGQQGRLRLLVCRLTDVPVQLHRPGDHAENVMETSMNEVADGIYNARRHEGTA
jgi:hypothetical protein